MSVKISQLAAGSNPVGPELVPVVQASQTVSLTIQQIINSVTGAMAAVDSGGVNAPLLTSGTTPLPLLPGQLVYFTPKFTNTGPVVITFNGSTAKVVGGPTGQPLTGGELSPTGPVLMSYNGASFQIIATVGESFANAPGNIQRYGAVVGTDCSAAITAAAAANTLVTIPPGLWTITATPTVPAGVILDVLPGATFTGAGAAALGLGGIAEKIHTNTVANDFVTSYLRRTATHAGGTAGFVNSAMRVETYVTNAGDTNYEWAFVAKMDNSATAGQNVASYSQAFKRAGAGPTWAAVCEAIDPSGAANPTTGLVGLEVDVRASGTDVNFARVGLDLVCTRYPVATGAAATIGFGYRVQCGGDGANVTIGSCFTAYNVTTAVAFDCSSATVTTGALRMASGVPVLFDAAGANKVLFDSTFAGSIGGITYQHSGVTVAGLGTDGGLYFGTGATANAAFKGTTYTTASAGVFGAVPGQVAGYIQLVLTGTTFKVPYFAA